MPSHPEFSARAADELAAIEGAAADWMIRRDRGLDPSEQRQLALWLRADARHAAAYNALAATWDLLGETRTEPAVPTTPAQRGTKFLWLAPLAAAAAAVAIACVGWWEIGRAAPATAYTVAAATEIGGLRKLELPDGSVIQLNTDSEVDVRFEKTVRRVRLTRGEAHFSVAKNPERPFIVSVAGVDVRVVGTVFNVRLRSESVDVLVTEGRVRVGSAVPENRGQRTGDGIETPSPVLRSPSSEIIAGQKVSIALAASASSSPKPLPAAPVDVSAAEIKQSLAWQSHRLDFDATPLADIVAEVNRYNRHKLVIDDPQLGGRRFGGSFPAGDYETFVHNLEANFEVVAERKGDTTLLRLR